MIKSKKIPYDAIFDAIDSGNSEELKRLFDEYPQSINFHLPGFGTWIHYAASNGTVDIVKYLVKIGFDINSDDKREGQYPICYCSSENKIDIAQYLVGIGSILDTSEAIRNPLFAAIVGRSREIISLLLKAGIDSSVRYTLKGMPNMDAVAFALVYGLDESAREIALTNAKGDAAAAEAALAEADKMADDFVKFR